MPDNAIVPYQSHDGYEVAKAALQSRIFGLQGMDEAIVKYQASKELGIGYVAGLEYLQVIQGKLTITPRGMLALALKYSSINFAVDYNYSQSGELESCTVSGYRIIGNEKITHVETFSLADARRADLVKKGGNWEKYPKNMLKWRAIGFWLDTVCPDVMFLKRTDEIATSADRLDVDGSWVPLRSEDTGKKNDEHY